MPSTNTLGRYQIVREIARSNDIVYEALDPVMKRRVALKELQMPPNLAGEQRRERVERFYREARAAGALTHANIVTIYEVGEEGGRHFIAMEFLEGESLRDRLQKISPLPLDEAVRIAVAVADGLHFAHQHGVVHRDVKPDNVHLLPDGRVKITDFGIARITFEPTLTADGQIFGTPSYMSPEQVTGKGIDARSDLFSLGVMLYEMTSGRKPFTGDSVITITYNIMNLEPSPLGGLPAPVQGIIRRAMAKSPIQRYRSAAEMGAELRAAAARGLSSAPPPAGPRRPVSSPYPSGPPPRPSQGRPSYPNPAGASPAAGAARPGGPVPRAPRPPAGSGHAIPRPAPGPIFPSSPRAGAAPRQGGAPARPRAAAPGGYGAPPGRVPPAPPPQYRPVGPPPAPLLSAETRWFLGWLAVAIVVALLLLLLIWTVLKGVEARSVSAGSPEAGPITRRAEQAYAARDYQRAWQLYKEAVDRGEKPRDRLAWYGAICAVNYAQDQQASGNLEEARRACQEAQRLAPDYGEAYHLQGVIAARDRNVDLALPLFQQAAEAWKRRLAQPNLPPEEARRAREMQANTMNTVLQVLIQDGRQTEADGQLVRARQRFQQVYEAAPPNSPERREAEAALARLPLSPGG